MTTKITSAEAYEFIKTKEFISFPEQTFDRAMIEALLKEASTVHHFTPPSAKSFLDWARRESIVEPVEGERGHYRWAPSVEAEAAEIGRQMTQERVAPPDTDPENPMVLTDPVVDDLDLAEDHFDYREGVEAETCQHHTDALAGLTEVVDVRLYIYTSQKRIPRKKKKLIKKSAREMMGIKNVQMVRSMDRAWEMSAR